MYFFLGGEGGNVLLNYWHDYVAFRIPPLQSARRAAGSKPQLGSSKMAKDGEPICKRQTHNISRSKLW